MIIRGVFVLFMCKLGEGSGIDPQATHFTGLFLLYLDLLGLFLNFSFFQSTLLTHGLYS